MLIEGNPEERAGIFRLLSVNSAACAASLLSTCFNIELIKKNVAEWAVFIPIIPFSCMLAKAACRLSRPNNPGEFVETHNKMSLVASSVAGWVASACGTIFLINKKKTSITFQFLATVSGGCSGVSAFACERASQERDPRRSTAILVTLSVSNAAAVALSALNSGATPLDAASGAAIALVSSALSNLAFHTC